MHAVHSAVIGDHGTGSYHGVSVSHMRCHAALVADRLINGGHYGTKMWVSSQEYARRYEFSKRMPLCNDNGLVAEHFEQQPIAIHEL